MTERVRENEKIRKERIDSVSTRCGDEKSLVPTSCPRSRGRELAKFHKDETPPDDRRKEEKSTMIRASGEADTSHSCARFSHPANGMCKE